MTKVHLKRGKLIGHFLCAFGHHSILKEHHRLNREIKDPFGQSEVRLHIDCDQSMYSVMNELAVVNRRILLLDPYQPCCGRDGPETVSR